MELMKKFVQERYRKKECVRGIKGIYLYYILNELLTQ